MMPVHQLTTVLPAMILAEAIGTTRIHRVAGLTGDRTALVTTRPFRAPHHTISNAGLISVGATGRCRARCRWRTTPYSLWINCPSAAAMSWRSYGSTSEENVIYIQPPERLKFPCFRGQSYPAADRDRVR
jgi:Magnesium chelatase, subunit ChlI